MRVKANGKLNLALFVTGSRGGLHTLDGVMHSVDLGDELEITESLLFEDKALLCRKLDTLRAAGIKILLDDFGTGYSSLTMLKDLPLDGIKLDKSFIDAYVSPKGDSLIKTMLGLARSLNLDVTAEGVETAEQYEYLKKLDCKTIQGYYFSKPVSGADLESLLKQNRPQ